MPITPIAGGHGMFKQASMWQHDDDAGSVKGARELVATKKTETAIERRAAQLVDHFGKDYPTFQYAVVDFLVEHLTDLSRSFDGDLQQVMLVAMIGQRGLHAVRQSQNLDEVDHFKASMTASRLSDVTAIPRETVRRKLALLKERGWIHQLPDGSWTLTSDGDWSNLPVRRDLDALDHRSRERVARLVAVLELLGARTR